MRKFDCFSCEGDWNTACGERSKGSERQVSFKAIHLHPGCSTLILICVLLPPAEWISLTFYQLFEKWGEMVWNTSEGGSRANLKESRVFHLISHVCSPHPFLGSQLWLNWCSPNFSSSCCLHVTLVLIYLKLEKRSKQLLCQSQSLVFLQPCNHTGFQCLLWLGFTTKWPSLDLVCTFLIKSWLYVYIHDTVF